MAEDFQKKCFGSTEDDLKISMKEASITETDVQNIIQLVKEWYKKQPHLPKEPFDDRFMLRFCLLNKYSIERIKEKLENYLVSRTIIPEIFNDRDSYDPKIINHLGYVSFYFIPKPTKENYRIIISQIHECNPALVDPIIYFKSAYMIFDMRLRYETTLGDYYICDLKDIKLAHVLKMTPSLLKKVTFISLSCYGFRVKGIFMINVPSYAMGMVNLVKSLIKKKIADRIHICSSVEDVHKVIKPEYLPVELGGYEKTSKDFMNDIIKEMQSDYWVKWYKESSKIKSDESKRIVKSDDKIGDLLGITGSFRKLDID